MPGPIDFVEGEDSGGPQLTTELPQRSCGVGKELQDVSADNGVEG